MASVVLRTIETAQHESPKSEVDCLAIVVDSLNRSTSSQDSESMTPAPIHHPDLDTEVTTLSNKLIDAINHQTSLDDSLADARHELEISKQRIRELENYNSAYAEAISQGLLIPKVDVDGQVTRLREKAEEEQKLRAAAEIEKRKIEIELETLTTALFEEANEMVSAARKEQDATERRNEQLRSQLADMETLLDSQREQLSELKVVLQRHSDREEFDTNTNISTAPTTPSMANSEQWCEIFKALHITPNSPGLGDVPPSNPTSFSHLLQPVLRTDLHAYDDFTSLLRISRSAAPSRVSSGSYSGLHVMGLGNSPTQSTIYTDDSTSTSQPASLTSSPVLAHWTSTGTSRDANPLTPALKETKFYKRVLVEDIEPTLRLETAPGLSWLARRNVINSMSEGALVVEPIPGGPTIFTPACSLCNEGRSGEEHSRTHRFRTSENDNAQQYPLCNYCLGRVRATCDFLGFLRMIKDGHWRTNGEEGERGAWEEAVRLREGMFWARIGGGVVPAFVQTKESPRSSSSEDRISDDIFDPPHKRIARKSSDLSTLATDPHNSFSEHDFAPKDLDADRASKAVTITNNESVEAPITGGSRLSITTPGSFD